MKVILFGATGMVGQGVLRVCLGDPQVTEVLSVGRSPLAEQHPKLRELIVEDVGNLSPIGAELTDYDACFFCLGVSSAGMSEADYRRVTYDLTLSAAKTLAQRNPQMTFIYVSGMGTDSTEKGRSMWARVKGETENALLRLPFKGAYMFRPGFVLPAPGIVSKTKLYRALYAVMRPIGPGLKRLFPRQVITSAELGRAMIAAAARGEPKRVLEPPDLVDLAGR